MPGVTLNTPATQYNAVCDDSKAFVPRLFSSNPCQRPGYGPNQKQSQESPFVLEDQSRRLRRYFVITALTQSPTALRKPGQPRINVMLSNEFYNWFVYHTLALYPPLTFTSPGAFHEPLTALRKYAFLCHGTCG